MNEREALDSVYAAAHERKNEIMRKAQKAAEINGVDWALYTKVENKADKAFSEALQNGLEQYEQDLEEGAFSLCGQSPYFQYEKDLQDRAREYYNEVQDEDETY